MEGGDGCREIYGGYGNGVVSWIWFGFDCSEWVSASMESSKDLLMRSSSTLCAEGVDTATMGKGNG
jgi:hypothetical protein